MEDLGVGDGDPSRTTGAYGASSALDTTTSSAPVELLRQAFIEKYDIKVVEGEAPQVELTLPIGVSRADFLKEANRWIAKYYGHDGACWHSISFVLKNEYSWAEHFREAGLSSHRSKSPEQASPLKIAVQGNWEGVSELQYAGSERTYECGADFYRIKAPVMDLMLAHLAYTAATGKDLFNGKTILCPGAFLKVYMLECKKAGASAAQEGSPLSISHFSDDLVLFPGNSARI